MKRTALLITLMLLASGSLCAQTKKATKTTVRTTHHIAQPTMMYIGIGMGQYVYTDNVEHYTAIGMGHYVYNDNNGEYYTTYESGMVGLQGGFLYSLFGDMNKSFTPFVGGEGMIGFGGEDVIRLGGEGMIGLDITEKALCIQASAVVGVMLGKPSFRLDVRLQPQLSYWGSGELRHYTNFGDYSDYDVESFRPNIAIRAGVWINHFNIYAQYNNIVSFGLGWRF